MLSYNLKMFPEPFGRDQLNLLRVLLAFARGQASWSEIDKGGNLAAADLKQPMLSKFIRLETARQGIDLEYSPKKVRLLHAVLYDFLAALRSEYRDPIWPLVRKLYVGLSHDAPGDSAWGALEQDFRRHHTPDLINEISACTQGVYYIYRYGVGREVYKSVIEIIHDKDEARPRMKFRAAYMLERTATGKTVVTIDGDVLIFGNYLFFLGRDAGSSTPYVLTAKKSVMTRSETSMHGVLLRHSPVGGAVFAARAYVRSTAENWEDAAESVEMYEKDYFKALFAGEFDAMKDYIDNGINAATTHVLADYISAGLGPRD